MNKTAKINNTKDPERTGENIYSISEFEITPKTAIAPEGGCKQRNICPRVIANATAIEQEKKFKPNNFIYNTADIAPKRLPKIRFLSCASGQLGTAKRRTVEAPNGAIRSVWFCWILIIPSRKIAINDPMKENIIFLLENFGWIDFPIISWFFNFENIYI